ncbi:hypothetical protein [Halioxenophilus aromaticivorans]|uniref:EthD domain-containing protein n=1 Tax=Halioxenophilus aromaticivorans TaxID=1306992 RepID=A0AAV3U437_9ALTE
MAAYKMVVLSNPKPGKYEVCDRWYRQTHLDDVVKLPSFIAAQRFTLAHPMAQNAPYQFMAVYDIETDDVERSFNELVQASEAGRMVISDDLDRDNLYAAIYACDGRLVKQL